MADETMRLHLDTGDSVAKATQVADALETVSVAAHDVGQSYSFVAASQTDYVAKVMTVKEADEASARAAREAAAAKRAAAKEAADAKRAEAAAARQAAKEEAAAKRAEIAAAKEAAREKAEAARFAAAATKQALKEEADAARAAAKAKQDYERASKRAAGETKNFSQEILAAGRITQDFAQGGVGGILNNIESVFIKFPKLASAATIAATAMYVGVPIIKGWYTAWRDGTNEIPDFVEGLDKLTGAIKENKEWIDKASEKGYLTDDEVTEFRRRVAEMTQGEKDLADAKKARVAVEQLAAVQTQESADAAAEASKSLKEALAGETGDVVTSVESRLTSKSQELKAAAAEFDRLYKEYSEQLDGVTDVAQINAINEGYTKKLAELTKLQGEIKQRIASDAANLVGEAVLKGSEESIKKIAGLGGQYADAFKTAAKAGRAARIKEAEEDAAELVKIIEDQEKALAKKYSDSLDNWVEGFADKLRGVNDQIRSHLEDFDFSEATDKNAAGAEIIRDVESRDFSRTTVDRFGREKEVAGLGLSSQQVEDAAKAAREFQRSAREQGGGLSDREAAQMAIQEQIVKNQQQMSDNWNMTNERMNRVLREARTVPSLLQFGMGQ